MAGTLYQKPDGTFYGVNDDGSVTEFGNKPPVQKPQTSSAASKLVRNIGPSAYNYGKGIVDAVTSPLQTAGAVMDVAAGGLQKIMPQGLIDMMDSPNAKRARDTASAVGDFYGNRYGSMEKTGQTLVNDPVGVMADVATLGTGGGAAIGKIPGLAKAGQVVSGVGKAVDPLNVAAKGIKLGAGTAADIIGGIGTHTGGAPVREAFNSGVAGGERGKLFRDNMRGTADMDVFLNDAKDALDKIRQQRGQDYRSGMVNIKSDKTVLAFKPILDDLQKQSEIGSFKGQVINPSTVETQKKLSDAITNWASLDPVEFHTPEGLDALKRAIGDIRDTTEFRTPSRKIADDAYNSVKGQILKQAPTYARVMGDYEQGSRLLEEIQRTFSMTGKAADDTIVRKLQSLMRNNVNTNYGQRQKLGQRLIDAGADKLLPSLAGQSMNSITPRGLGNLQAAGTGVASVMGGGGLGTIPLLAAQSPRVVGEVAHGAGRAYGLLDMLLQNGTIDPSVAANMLYQSGVPLREQQESNKR